jgi:phage terminase large subunit-like protein
MARQGKGIASVLADALADGGWRAKARPEQLPPAGDWSIWLALAGRGWGKTRTGASWVNELAVAGPVRIAIVTPTAADSRDVAVEGDSGVLRSAPDWCQPTYEPSKRVVRWPNGSVAHVFSAEEPDRLRGPQFHYGWLDELAAMPNAEEVWNMYSFALRLGTHPRTFISTTPRPIKLLRELLKREGKDVAVVRGSTFDNERNLARGFLDAVKRRYDGTRIGRQELFAELLSDTPGALWTCDMIEKARIELPPKSLDRIVVSIDPAISTSEGADETGIIVAGTDGVHAYVLADASGRYQPHDWAGRTIGLYAGFKCDRIVAESNQGGEMVRHTIASIDRNVPVKLVHASRGKVTRAEPVSALYEQGRVHHVGNFPQLEYQMTAFTSDFNRNTAGYSPDRVDALVWCLTELLVTNAHQHVPLVAPHYDSAPSYFRNFAIGACGPDMFSNAGGAPGGSPLASNEAQRRRKLSD